MIKNTDTMAGRPILLLGCWFRLLWCAALLAVSALAVRSAETGGAVLVTDIQGVIGVASSRQVGNAIAEARRSNACCLVIRLDTPGGLVSATRDIIRQMLTAPVPVIVYVTPGGAHAASAGTFIVYAAHIAAMAPGTNIGAATPIQIGGFPGAPQPEEPKGDGKTAPTQTTAERKALNDTIAMLRSLAQLRGRNIEWAEQAVRDAATLTAADALKEHVIDIVASDLDDLLTQIDGRTVTIGGVEHRLATKAAERVVFEVDWRTRILGAISDPTIAFMLLLIGFYGILFEFWSPGFVAPGVIGAICLLLALTALSSLPVQYGALALVLLGLAFMIGEAFAPSFGALGIGGVIAFVTGALFLFDPAGSDIDIAVSLPVIIVSAITTAALLFLVLAAALRVRRRPAITGAEQMIGSVGEVVEWSGRSGRIRVHGEMWFARSEHSLAPPAAVRVVRREGLTLFVEPQ